MNFTIKEADPKPKKLIWADCTCGYSADADTFEKDYDHHNGWEMPAYTELLCPKCEDGGCVDAFIYYPEEDK